MPRLLVLAAAMTATSAAAQNTPRPERLYISPIPLAGSPRVIGMGGAQVGIAEGADGFTTNLAALSHRKPWLSGNWDFDGTFSIVDLPLGNPGGLDLDNDGEADQAVSSSQFLAAFGLQIRRFGFGMFYRSSNRTFCATEICPQSDHLGISLAQAAIAGSFSFLNDDLLLGLGLYSAKAGFGYHGENWGYSGDGLALSALYRPHMLPIRVGANFFPEVEGRYGPSSPSQSTDVAGRRIHGAVVAPAVFSVGVSARAGEGNLNYNRLSPKARAVMAADLGEAKAPPDLPIDAPSGNWTFSAQLDFLFPVDNAISPVNFTSLDPNRELNPVLIGGKPQLVPRLGVENDTFPRRLRTRLGTYLEPSPFEGVQARWHFTFGAELRLFKFLAEWTAYVAADLGDRYRHVAFGISIWQGAPPPPPPPEREIDEDDER